MQVHRGRKYVIVGCVTSGGVTSEGGTVEGGTAEGGTLGGGLGGSLTISSASSWFDRAPPFA